MGGCTSRELEARRVIMLIDTKRSRVLDVVPGMASKDGKQNQTK